MRIDKALQKAAAFNPTKKTHLMSIFDMCNKISEETISLPLYQRDLSWTLQKSIDLFNYQLLGKAPVSPLSINEINDTKNCVLQVSFVDREIINDIKRGQFSIVDGQQRLTTNYKAYSNHDDFRNVVLDLGKGKFIELRGATNSNQIPVGVLLNKDDGVLFDYTSKKPRLNVPDVTNLLIQIKSKIKNYNYTINSAEDLTEDEQIEWFEVLNNAGSRVSIVQMRFSKMKSKGIDIYKQYTNLFRTKVEEAGYDCFFTPQKTVVTYPVAALNPAYERVTKRQHTNNYAPIPSDTKENQLSSLKPEQLAECFSITLDALDKALDFIQDYDLKKPDRIDYINYITGLFVYSPHELNDDVKDSVVEWYDTVDFKNKNNTERRNMFTDLLRLNQKNVTT